MSFLDDLAGEEPDIGERVRQAMQSSTPRIRWAAYAFLAHLGSFAFALRTLHNGAFKMFVTDMTYVQTGKVRE